MTVPTSHEHRTGHRTGHRAHTAHSGGGGDDDGGGGDPDPDPERPPLICVGDAE
jgi:hypothetical protein